MSQYTADSLYSILTSSSYDNNDKCRAITDLKTHIKRDFVELSQVQKYFECLKLASKSNDYKLSSLAFSSICHLIKRVSMQDPNCLRGCYKIVLPLLFNRLLDSKANFNTQAKSSLETFWLATPSVVESYIRDNALIHLNPKIRAESIVFISELIELNNNFNFSSFLPNLVNLLRDDSTEVTKNTEVLLLKYYTLNKNKINDLVKEFKNQKIEQRAAVKLLRDIDLVAANSYSVDTKPKPTIDTFNNLSRNKRAAPHSATALQSSKSLGSLSTLKEITDILSKIPTAALDDSITPIYVTSPNDLTKEVNALLPPFAGRESEHNWNNREKNIIKFRALIIGNANQYPDELLQATRTLTEGISKSISSLRTTLSSNGCQLVKELAVHLGKHIDPITESLYQPLASLTSATKKIASLNAFGSISVLLTNTSFNNRLFNQCFNLFQDKNVQPRLYSVSFLQIFLLRHDSKIDYTNMETVKKWVTKGVCDPNTNVRESMRTTFWLLLRKFPDVGNGIYSKLDTSVRKALDRSKPKDAQDPVGSSSSTSKPNLTIERKRQSIRDFVAAKREGRSISGSQVGTNATATEVPTITDETSFNTTELGKPGRIGMPQRVSSTGTRISSSGSMQPLPKQPSRGSLERQRWASVGSTDSAKPLKENEGQPKPTNFKSLDNLLKSSYTRERVEGINNLKNLLIEDVNVTGISSSLNNLVLLDATLLKPLLEIPSFFNLIDTVMAIKLLTVNQCPLDIIVKKSGTEIVIQGLVSLIKSLESLQFESAPSTMFHIKHKNLLLNNSVQNIYQLISNDTFKPSQDLLREICVAAFPLSISDYSKYDELVVELYTLNVDAFEEVLSNSSSYIKSKIGSIIEEFKDDMLERPTEFTEHGLNEMTMINPLSKTLTDPTLSLDPGFSTDMTRIVPTINYTDFPKDTDSLMLDEKDHKEEKKVDYMSGIFSKESTPDVEMKQETDELVITPVINRNRRSETGRSSSEALGFNHEAGIGSPFFENLDEDDIIHSNDLGTDEATKSLTNKINEIHISPEKVFKSPNRESLSKMIIESDPIFNKAKAQIKIFEDAPSNNVPSQPSSPQRKLFDFELSRFQYSKGSTDVTVESLKNLCDRMVKDKIGTIEMDSMIEGLHQVINLEDVVLWLKESGFVLIMDSLITYFNSSINITKQLCFKGLIVFKELLIINDFLDGCISLENSISIWNILVMIIENLKNFKNEIYISVDELVEDLLELDIEQNTREILNSCSLRLKESSTLLLTSFLLLTLTRCIDKESLSLAQIKEIDNIVYKFLSNDEVEIRRLTIITYSKCKRKLQKFKSHSRNSSMIEVYQDNDQEEIKDIYKDVFDKLSIPERKLVDYYCDY